jgi:hypothetical protein
MFRSSVVLMSLGGGEHRGFHALSDPSARTARRFFLCRKGSMAKHGIRSWRSWIEGKNEMMITKDTIIRRNADGSFLHHGASVLLPGFGRVRDGDPVGGIGEESLGYRENNRTNRPIAGTEARRADGAIRDVLACWGADRETEIVEESGLKYLLLWTPLQPGEGAPENAVMTNAIGRTSVSGPEATRDAHRQMFGRVMDHNAKKPLVARKALAAIKRDTGAMESINARNREFWSGKI